MRCAVRCMEPVKLVCMTAKPLIAAHHAHQRTSPMPRGLLIGSCYLQSDCFDVHGFDLIANLDFLELSGIFDQ